MRILYQFLRSTLNTLQVLAAAVSAFFKSRAALQLENLALRHQLGVLQRSVKRPKLAPADRLLWVWLCAVWSGWRSALIIVKPNTVIAWHRRSFRLFWTWKVRRGQPGRPAVSKEIRQLIRRLSRENPLWGAPRARPTADWIAQQLRLTTGVASSTSTLPRRDGICGRDNCRGTTAGDPQTGEPLF